MEEVSKIDILRGLFAEREQMRVHFNNSIANMIKPVALQAIFELFELESEAVEWSALDVVDETLLIAVKITYTTNEKTPEFLKMMDIISKAGPDARVRTLRIGLPFSLVFTSREEIKQYLISSAEKMVKQLEPKKAEPSEEFDQTQLSPSQLQQLLLFRTMQKTGDKQ